MCPITLKTSTFYADSDKGRIISLSAMVFPQVEEMQLSVHYTSMTFGTLYSIYSKVLKARLGLSLL